MFLKAKNILERLGFDKGYKMAALSNNINAAYRAKSDFKNAEKVLKITFNIIKNIPKTKKELRDERRYVPLGSGAQSVDPQVVTRALEANGMVEEADYGLVPAGFVKTFGVNKKLFETEEGMLFSDELLKKCLKINAELK